MEAKEVVELLEKYDGDWKDVVLYGEQGQILRIAKNVTLEAVDSQFTLGGLGDGVQYQSIFKIVETGQTFALDITYSSYDEHYYELESLYEVKPVEKTFTIYEAA